MEVFIARQAILDRNQRLYAYELLFRPCEQNHAVVSDDSASTLQVLSTALLSAGLSVLSDKTPIFINFGREMLMSSWTSLFPSSAIVIEILESVKGDPEVLSACTALKEQGYALALDDVTESADPEFLKLADIIKVDFRGSSPETQAKVARDFKLSGKRLLAEKVETLEEFERAKQLGFHYFQGFFFSKPVLLQGRQGTSMKGSMLRLLTTLQLPEIDFKRLEELIRCDLALTYKLLRYVNSALFARAKPIAGVRAALITMGELDIRRWIILATLLDLSGRTQVLASHALIRARFCESLAVSAGSRSPADAFLIGMFSLLDALLNRPLPELLMELGLPSHVTAQLLGREVDSIHGSALGLAKCYEAGDWDGVSEASTKLGIADQTLAGVYLASVDWASQIMTEAASPTAVTSDQPKSSDSGNGNDLLALERGVMRTETKRQRSDTPAGVTRSRD